MDQDRAVSEDKDLTYSQGQEAPAEAVSLQSSKHRAQGPQPWSSNPYLGRYLAGSRGKPREEPETPNLGQAQEPLAFQDTQPPGHASPSKAAFKHKNSAPTSNKKASKSGRDYDYSHVKSRLGPTTRQRPRKTRDSKKKATGPKNSDDPSQSANYGEEDEDLVDTDNLQGSHGADVKSAGSRRN